MRAPKLPPELIKLADEKLKTYGISYKEAPLYNIEILTAEQTTALGPEFEALPSLLFKYQSLEGSITPIKQFFRVRYLTAPDLGGWGIVLKAPRRYAQPKGSLNEIYLSPAGPEGKKLNWSKIAEDATLSLFIVEGEGKGICGCKYGLPTLALGGVQMFTAEKKGIGLLPTLAKINWVNRTTYIIFDSDSAEGYKPQVYTAAKRLANELISLGAIIKIVVLPNGGTGKVGFDDYLLSVGIENLLEEVLPSSEVTYKDFDKLQKIAVDYGYLENLDRFIFLKYTRGDVFYKYDQFNRATANIEIEYPVKTRMKSGNTYYIAFAPAILKAGDALLRWPGRQSFRGVMYNPGQPRILNCEGGPYLNMWLGWKNEYLNTDRLPSPKRREVILSEWFWALDNVFGSGDMREFAEHWLHYPIKFPGTKLNTLLMVYSKLQGIGKSFIGHMLAKHLYGVSNPGPTHAWILKHGEMEREFNRYKMATSLIVMDEAVMNNKKEWYERLKSDVTENVSQINRKNVDEIMMEVRQNYYISCNFLPTVIEKFDRRLGIHEAKGEKAPERYAALDNVFASGEAASTLLWWAREKYEEGNFCKNTEAPMSHTKEGVISSSQSELHAWVSDIFVPPFTLGCRVATTEELLLLYRREHPEDAENSKYSTNVMGAILNNLGAVRWKDGAYAYYSGGRNRFWILDDRTNLSKCSKEVLLKELEKPLVRIPEEGFPSNVTPITKGKKPRKY